MIEQLFVKDASVIKRITIYPEILAKDIFWDLNNIYFVILVQGFINDILSSNEYLYIKNVLKIT